MLCRYFYNMQLGSPEVANVYFQYFRGGKLLPFCWCFVIRYYICFEDDNKNWLQGKYFHSIFELSFCADCDFVVVLDSCLLIGAKRSVMDLQNLFRIRIGSILFIIYDRKVSSHILQPGRPKPHFVKYIHKFKDLLCNSLCGAV